jgi:hypothetical protein
MVSPGQAYQRRNVCGLSIQVHRGQGAGAGRDSPLDVSGIERESVWIDIGEHGLGSRGHNHGSGRHKSKVGHDHFVAWFKQGTVGKVECRCSRTDGHGKARANGLGEARLEFRYHAAGAKLTAPQDLLDGPNLVRSEANLGHAYGVNGRPPSIEKPCERATGFVTPAGARKGNSAADDLLPLFRLGAK